MWSMLSVGAILILQGVGVYREYCHILTLRSLRANYLDELTRNEDSTIMNQLLYHRAPVVVMVEMDWELIQYMLEEIGIREYYFFNRSDRTLYCLNVPETVSDALYQPIRNLGIRVHKLTTISL